MDRSSALLTAAVFVLAAALLLVDLLVPLGVTVWLLYVAVVLLSLWFPLRWQTCTAAAACTVLMVLGLFFSPSGSGSFWTAAINRLLGVFAIWIAAIVGLATRRTRQLREANRRLQFEIAERERLQAQLLRNQRLESIGVLASGIAHDFNNLLTPILMSVKLLKEDRPEEERRHLLATLLASAERGADMVRQLLAFAGGTEGERTTVQVAHVIHEIQAILEHTVPKTIRIVVDLADALKPIHADPTQLAQVLMNLCINARDAMPAGGTLTVQARDTVLSKEDARMHLGARPGPYVRIAVADTGAGIAPDVLDRVFDPFFTTKGPGKGTGLGLSTALGIVRGHGGFINVHSEVGQGSRFEVLLPAAADGQVGDTITAPTAPGAGRGELVLVVDDEPFILDMARATLEHGGYRVVTATSGDQAIEIFQQQPRAIRAVILDMMMPGTDGQATLAALETLDPKVRIIFSSGIRPGGRVAEAIRAGRCGFLPKPYTDEQILAALSRILTKGDGEP